MRPFPPAPLLLAALLGAAALPGCRDKETKTDQPQPKKKEGPKRIDRFKDEFKDAGSNAKTGEKLAEKKAKLVDEKGQEVGLEAFLGKSVVLVFMRGFSGYICPYCTTYTAQLAAKCAEFKQAGAEILVVYPTKADEGDKVKDFVDVVNQILKEDGREAIPFPVFLDPGTKVVRTYNLEGDLSKPSTFVLDAKGEVRYAYVGATKADRPSVERVLKEVQALSGK